MIKIIIPLVIATLLFNGCNANKYLDLNKSKSNTKTKKVKFSKFADDTWFKDYKVFKSNVKQFDISKLKKYEKDRLLERSSMSKYKPCQKIEYLLENGIAKKDINFSKFIDNASNYGVVEGLKCLQRHGADINYIDYKGDNALGISIQRGKMKMFKYLLTTKIYINKKNNKGLTPYDISVKNNRFGIRKLLKKAGALSVMLDGLRMEEYIKKNKKQILSEYLVNQYFDVKKPKYPKKPKPTPFPNQQKLTKGEFETTKAFHKRVNKAKNKRDKKIKSIIEKDNLAIKKYNKKIDDISNQYNSKIEYLTKNIQKIKALSLKKVYMHYYGKPNIKDLTYDADKEEFSGKLISSKNNLKYNIKFKVPIKHAKYEKKWILKNSPKVIFEYDNKNIVLKKIKIKGKKGNYNAYMSDEVHNKENYEIVINNTLKRKETKFKQAYLKNIPSINIGKTNRLLNKDLLRSNDELEKLLLSAKSVKENQNKYAVVVGIEKYKYEDDVSYASNSANLFSRYLNKTLGVPKDNISLFSTEDTTQTTNLKINWGHFLQILDKNSVVYFYYAGHGIPSQNGYSYLMASDGNAKFTLDDDALKLANIYKTLENSKAKKVYAFIDSCFSGYDDKGNTLIKGVAGLIKHKKTKIDSKKLTVFTAGTNEHFANQYKQKKHRMFSYYLMKGLAMNKKESNELHKYVKNNVWKESKSMGTRHIQIPQLKGNKDAKLF
ncbi:MAG: ankyrin repeat domain-containing protein [Bacteroidota bacterium]|nr:ankyrin repeat domain-containing protein [Bacteroidota bacterium]